MSRVRLWLERIGVGVVAFLSLTAPFVFGFVHYLGVTDGLEINVGDPLRESRVWMIHERRGPVGIGWRTPAQWMPHKQACSARTHSSSFSSGAMGFRCALMQSTASATHQTQKGAFAKQL